MFKKTLSAILTVIMMMSCFSPLRLTAFAGDIDVSASGEQSGDYTYEILEDGTARITDFKNMSAKTAAIPAEVDGYAVTVIGSNSISSGWSLTEVTVPDSVITIERHGCSTLPYLEKVNLGSGLKSIGDDAFHQAYTYYFGYNDHKTIKNVYIPPSVTHIGERAFGYIDFIQPNGNHNQQRYNITITGYNNTEAQRYAQRDNREFVSLGDYEHPTDISKEPFTVDLSKTSYTYDGTAKEPTVTVTDGSDALTLDTDYTVSYKNNVNAGTGTATVTGKGNYTGTVSKSFTIGAKSLTSASLTLSQSSYTYDGTEKKPTVTVKDGSTTLTSGTDYTVAYSNNKNVGTATVTVTGKGNYTGNLSKNFTISEAAKPDIANCTVTLGQTSYTYDGTAKQPVVTVKDGTKTLTKGTDYTVSYKNHVNAGTGTATVTGKGNYTGTVSKSFTIGAKSLTSASLTLSQSSYTYDGTEKKPTVTVKDGSTTLTSGTDYTVAYSNNKNVGTATVTVTGKGNYTGNLSKNFTISEAAKPDIANCTVTLGQTSYTYDGTAKQPVVTVKDGTKTLTKGTDYSVSYKNNVNAGTGTATVTGKGNFTGTVSKSFTIGAKSLTSASISLSQSSYTYDGTEKKPTVTVKDGSTTLTSGTDYSVAYTDNVNAGNAIASVSGKGNYSGTVTKIFHITEKSISSATVTVSPTSYTFDGTAKRPTVTVKDGSKTLTNGSAYYVSYEDNINIGTAKVTVNGIGNYTGIISKTFTIKEAPKINISTCTVSLSQQTYNYDGTAKKPYVTVKHDAKTLTENTDFRVTYSNNISVGTATATVTGIGGYTGTVTKQFSIVNAKPEFVWGQDNWNFLNSSWSGHFKDSTYREQISNSYLNALKNNLTNSEFQVINGGYYANYSWLDEEWGGSCYGMSSLALLSKLGVLPYADYKAGATKLHDLSYPKIDSNVSSLITYYQMLQVKDVIQQQYRTVPYRSNETNIKEIISLLDTNPTVLVCFDKYDWGGHAILATGYEYGSYTWNGVTYQGCIKICDPNCSMEYDKEYNIYFNTQSYNWAIPAYSRVTSVSGAEFSYIGANPAEINEGGYLSGASGNKSGKFVARIDADKIANNRSVSKIKKSNGSYVNMATAPGDIIEDYSYVFSGESKGKIGYNLFDSAASYRVSQDDAQELQLGIDYQTCNMYGGSKAGKAVLFDPSGYIEVSGETASYSLAMTFDEDYPTDWFNIEVSGDNANNASLQKADNGFILNSDSLKNVLISVNNKDVSATLSFSTDYNSVFIYEINENTVGALVDTDSNGTYDTNVLEAHKFNKMIPGDVNGDGKTNAQDCTAILRYVRKIDTGLSDYQLKCGDVTGDGKTNVQDVTRILRHVRKIEALY